MKKVLLHFVTMDEMVSFIKQGHFLLHEYCKESNTLEVCTDQPFEHLLKINRGTIVNTQDFNLLINPSPHTVVVR